MKYCYLSGGERLCCLVFLLFVSCKGNKMYMFLKIKVKSCRKGIEKIGSVRVRSIYNILIRFVVRFKVDKGVISLLVVVIELSSEC